MVKSVEGTTFGCFLMTEVLESGLQYELIYHHHPPDAMFGRKVRHEINSKVLNYFKTHSIALAVPRTLITTLSTLPSASTAVSLAKVEDEKEDQFDSSRVPSSIFTEPKVEPDAIDQKKMD